MVPRWIKKSPPQRVFLTVKETTPFKQSEQDLSLSDFSSREKGNSGPEVSQSSVECVGVFLGSAQKPDADFTFSTGRNKEINEYKCNPASSLGYDSRAAVINRGLYSSLEAAYSFKTHSSMGDLFSLADLRGSDWLLFFLKTFGTFLHLRKLILSSLHIQSEPQLITFCFYFVISLNLMLRNLGKTPATLLHLPSREV